MIIEEIKHLCPDCGSDQLKRNGFTSGTSKNTSAKRAGDTGQPEPQQSYSQEVRDQGYSTSFKWGKILPPTNTARPCRS